MTKDELDELISKVDINNKDDLVEVLCYVCEKISEESEKITSQNKSLIDRLCSLEDRLEPVRQYVGIPQFSTTYTTPTYNTGPVMYTATGITNDHWS